jgi:hypothetical protein
MIEEFFVSALAQPFSKFRRFVPVTSYLFQVPTPSGCGSAAEQRLPSLGMGSIPIARSITHDDSIGLAHLNCLNLAEKWPFLDPMGRR